MWVCGFLDYSNDLSISAEVSGVLELYGPTNLTVIDATLREHPYGILTRSCNPDELIQHLAAISPIQYVKPDAKLPPTLLAQGEEDRLVSVDHAEWIYSALTEQNVEVEYYCLSRTGHGNWRFFDSFMMDKYTAFIKAHTK